MLSSEVSGEIIELPINEGDQVQKGDLLVKINPDLIQSALTQAQAGLQNAKAGLAQAEASLKNALNNYQRNATLFDKGVISKSEWDRVWLITRWPKPQDRRHIIPWRVPSLMSSKGATISIEPQFLPQCREPFQSSL